MKNVVLVSLLIILLLPACDYAKFDRYPGTKLDSIPQEFRGIYKDPDKKSKIQNNIIVEKNYWMESTKSAKYYLSDSFILSTYKGDYFLTTLEDNKRACYVLYLKTSGTDLLLYPILYDDKKPKEKNSMTKYFSPQIEKDSSTVFMMNEEKLWEYTQKELLKGESMKLKRQVSK